MRWEDAKALYVSACGQASAAATEAYTHLAEGMRWVSGRLDLQEQDSVDTEKFTVTGQDYVSLPDDVASIITVVNYTTGRKLDAEPNGLRGRTLYFEEGTGKPALSEPTFWVRASNRLYLRGTPDNIYTLRILYKGDSPAPSDATLDDEIPIPEDYHMAVVLHSAVSFLSLHPEVAQQISASLPTLIQGRDQAMQIMQPKSAEKFDRRDRFYLRSFRVSGRF